MRHHDWKPYNLDDPDGDRYWCPRCGAYCMACKTAPPKKREVQRRWVHDWDGMRIEAVPLDCDEVFFEKVVQELHDE